MTARGRREIVSLTHAEALRWIEQVDADVFFNEQEDFDNAWTAVVRTPPRPGEPEKVILAFCDTMLAVTAAAEEQWQQLWKTLSQTH